MKLGDELIVEIINTNIDERHLLSESIGSRFRMYNLGFPNCLSLLISNGINLTPLIWNLELENCKIIKNITEDKTKQN